MPLVRSPIRPLLLLALIAGLSLFAVAAAAHAADEPREGYVRVPAVVSAEKAYGPQQNGCAVSMFLIWKKLANEDVAEPFFGHYVHRGGEVTKSMRSPFSDAGVGGVHKFSGAPADSHKQELGSRSTAPSSIPGNTRDDVCTSIIERSSPDWAAEPSQVWVEVPVIATVAPTVRITAGPNRRTTMRKAAFRFRASEDSAFQCRLTGKNVKRKLRRWRSCGAGELARGGRMGYRKLRPGRKAFHVRATNAAGNRSVPAVRKWNVTRKRR